MSSLDWLHSRRIDLMVMTVRLMNEAYSQMRNDDAVKYVIRAMQPIDPEHTAVSYGKRAGK